MKPTRQVTHGYLDYFDRRRVSARPEFARA